VNLIADAGCAAALTVFVSDESDGGGAVVMMARATTANADLLVDDAACSLSPCGCYVGDWFTATSTGCGVQVPVERIAPLLADARIMRTNAKTRQKYLWVIGWQDAS